MATYYKIWLRNDSTKNVTILFLLYIDAVVNEWIHFHLNYLQY